MRRITSLVLLGAMSLALAGACNTVKGMGRDVQAAGRSVEGLFDKTEDEAPAP